MQKNAVDAIKEYRKQPAEVTRKTSKIRLYIIEEQEILRETYSKSLSSGETIEVVGLSASMEADGLEGVLTTVKPDVLCIGVKVLRDDFIDRLEASWRRSPCSGIVLLSAMYEISALKRLRTFTRQAGSGCAYLFKHSVDNITQLSAVIQAVSQRQVIVDPVVMGGLIEAGESRATTFLRELSPWELEVLTWMAKGFKNQTIAEILCVELKTVQRYVNSIYSKLGPYSDSKHRRVNAINLFLRATGQLPNDELADE